MPNEHFTSNNTRNRTIDLRPIQQRDETALFCDDWLVKLPLVSIAFRDLNHGIIVGGVYRKPNDVGATAASTDDGGKTWALIERPFPLSLRRRLGTRSVDRGRDFRI